MLKHQTLRRLVNERLTAAAEEIFALFERTIAEYEDEVYRSKNCQHRNNERLVDEVNPRVELVIAGTEGQIPAPPPVLAVKQELTQTTEIKEEPEERGLKQEEELQPLFAPELVFMKIDESSLFQGQSEAEPISSEAGANPHHRSDRETPYSAPEAQTDTGAGILSEIKIRDRKRSAQSSGLHLKNNSEPKTTVHDIDVRGADGGAQWNRHQCAMCGKTFVKKRNLQRHIKVHLGERPYSCSWCMKTFARKDVLDLHIRIHTGDKRYTCVVCNKAFTHRGNLGSHMRVHTGEKPYVCSLCNKGYADHSTFKKHVRSHSEHTQS